MQPLKQDKVSNTSTFQIHYLIYLFYTTHIATQIFLTCFTYGMKLSIYLYMLEIVLVVGFSPYGCDRALPLHLSVITQFRMSVKLQPTKPTVLQFQLSSTILSSFQYIQPKQCPLKRKVEFAFFIIQILDKLLLPLAFIQDVRLLLFYQKGERTSIWVLLPVLEYQKFWMVNRLYLR